MPITIPDASVRIALPDGRIDAVWLRALQEIAEQLNALSAATVPYDNATSGLTATDVQAALDEIEARVEVLEP